MKHLVRTPALLAWLRLHQIKQKVTRASSVQLSAMGLTDAQFYSWRTSRRRRA
jgi:hypothetical protein